MKGVPIAVAEEEGSESEEDELKPRGTISLNLQNYFFLNAYNIRS